MSLHRPNAINSKEKLFETITYLDEKCSALVMQAYGSVLPVAGNVAIFTHSENEYHHLKLLTKSLIHSSANPKQKYFQLIEPIKVGNNEYRWLYIRKPNPDSPQRGDIDFLLDQNEYNLFKQMVENGKIKSARRYDRLNWDMIEIFDPKSDVLPYIATKLMAERVRLKD
jgi:hypothetical protein